MSDFQDYKEYDTILGHRIAAGDKIIEEAGKEFSVRKVTLLGSDEELTWELTEEGLSIRLPGSGLDEMSVVFKIETNG